MALGIKYDPDNEGLGQKLKMVSWPLLLILCIIAGVGFCMLYSAGNGNWEPWASRQLTRFIFGAVILLLIAVTDIRIWLRYSYFIYFLSLALLIAVELKGVIGMGAQRWIDLKFVQLQPSEIMKIAIVLALARYFHGVTLSELKTIRRLLTPVLLVAIPVGLVLRQPDLGTAVMLGFTAVVVFFLAGVQLWKFLIAGLTGLAFLPLAWSFLHEYQKRRVVTFLDPESDPLGAGYHIIQSKIALGSGGVFGKGLLAGTQSHLSFLPEKQTDFIFTMFAEEFGLIGSLTLLVLYTLLIGYGLFISYRVGHQFGRLVCAGVMSVLFFYVFINMAMVMGLVPVVGVPLPLISYGGTSMLSLMIGFGLLMSANVHRNVQINRHGDFID